jgi:hypothetical protein
MGYDGEELAVARGVYRGESSGVRMLPSAGDAVSIG